ncbi:MAG TPA: phasin family protein [Bradyrhizobium sp.]|nr:phasin family protein [Bradyrhizobium sp.]
MLSADGNKPTGKPGQRKRKGEGKKAAEARKRKTVLEAAQQANQPDQLQDTAEAINPPVAAIEDPTISAPAPAATASAAMTAIEPTPVESLPDDSFPAVSEAVTATDVPAEMPPPGLAAIDWSPAASPEAVPAASAEPVAVAMAEPTPVAMMEPTPVAMAEPTPVALVEAVSEAAMEAAPVASAELVPSASAETAPVSYQTIANAYGDLTRRSLDQTSSFFEKFWGVRSLDKVFELQTEFAKQAYDNFCAESQRIRDLHRELARQRLERWEGFVGMTKAR